MDSWKPATLQENQTIEVELTEISVGFTCPADKNYQMRHSYRIKQIPTATIVPNNQKKNLLKNLCDVM